MVGSRAGATTVLLSLPAPLVGQPLPASAVTVTQAGRSLQVQGGSPGPADAIEVVLVLDTSGRTPIEPVRETASSLLRSLPRESRAAVIVAGARPDVRQVLVTDPLRGLPAVADLRPGSGPALADSLRVAVQQVLPSDPDRQQHVVVVASGPDTASSSDLDQTMALARRRGVVVEVLNLGEPALPSLGAQCPAQVAEGAAASVGAQVAARIADRRRLLLPVLVSDAPVTVEVDTDRGSASTVLDRRDPPAASGAGRPQGTVRDGVGLGTLLLAFVVGLFGLALLLLALSVRSRRGRLALDATRSLAECGLSWFRERRTPDGKRRVPQAELRRRLTDAVQDLRAGFGDEPTAVQLAWENALLDQAIWAEDQARERLRRERLDARAKAAARVEAALQRAQEQAAIERAAREVVGLAAADLGQLSEREQARLAKLEELVADRLGAAQRAVAQAEQAVTAEQAAAERAAAQRAEAERTAARAAALAAEQIAAAERARVEREEAEREAARLAQLLEEQRDRASRVTRQHADDEAEAAARLEAAHRAVADAEESAATELAAAARATMQRVEAERAAASAAALAAEQTQAAEQARIEREDAEREAARATELLEAQQALARNGQPAAAEPVAVEPVVEEPAVAPVVEEPVVEEPAVAPVVEEPVVEEPVVEEPAAAAVVEPAVEAPAALTVDLRPVPAVPVEQPAAPEPVAPAAYAAPPAEPATADIAPAAAASGVAAATGTAPPVTVVLRTGPRTGRSRRGSGRPPRQGWPGAEPPSEPPVDRHGEPLDGDQLPAEPIEAREPAVALTTPPASPPITVPLPAGPVPVHLMPRPETSAGRPTVSANMASGSPVVRLTRSGYQRNTDFAAVRKRLLDLRAETRAGSEEMNLEARLVRWLLLALVPLVFWTRSMADTGWIDRVIGDAAATAGLLAVVALTALGGVWVWHATSPPFPLRRGPSVRAEWQLMRSLNVAEQLSLRLAAGSPPDTAVQRVASLNHVPIGPFSAATPGLAVAMAVRLRRDLQRRRTAVDGRVAAAAVAPLLLCLLPAIVILLLL